jgi:hypothetical protein
VITQNKLKYNKKLFKDKPDQFSTGYGPRAHSDKEKLKKLINFTAN